MTHLVLLTSTKSLEIFPNFPVCGNTMKAISGICFVHLIIWINLLITLQTVSGSEDTSDIDPGDPLFLTPYIQAGQLEDARNISRVGPITDMDVKSYSGYLTVDPEYNSNLFFWFFPATSGLKTAPVILWLQGGPGASDMYGLFVEIGPYSVNSDLKLSPNKYTWISDYNVIFIDSPVGTGFSFTDVDKGYARKVQDVSVALANALRQFFTLFPDYAENEFYLSGESYAGKYIPSLAHEIHVSNPDSKVKINLIGLSIGNAFMDPVTLANYGPHLHGLGLIDQNQLKTYETLFNRIETYITIGSFDKAFEIFDQLLFGDFYPYPTVFTNTTGLKNYHNILMARKPKSYYRRYVNQPKIRHAIQVGKLPFHKGSVVESYLTNDIMNTTKPFLEALLDIDYKVMLYNGQLDICVPYELTMQMVNTMSWKTKDDYSAAPRLIWKVDDKDVEVAGYAKPSHNFVEVLVRNAGHNVPYDQPRAAQDLIRRFIQGIPWTNEN